MNDAVTGRYIPSVVALDWAEAARARRAAAAQPARPRYAFVRSPGRELPSDHGGHSLPHALYDIVDNARGAERVLAYGVRYDPAVAIVGALNAREEEKLIEYYLAP